MTLGNSFVINYVCMCTVWDAKLNLIGIYYVYWLIIKITKYEQIVNIFQQFSKIFQSIKVQKSKVKFNLSQFWVYYCLKLRT